MRAENPDKTAGTSNVSQNAPAIWRSNSVVQSPPVNVAVAIRQMVMKRLYEISPSDGIHVGILESNAKGREPYAEHSQKRDGQNGKFCLPDPQPLRRLGQQQRKRVETGFAAKCRQRHDRQTKE